jgi:hypothetical protein
MSASKLMPEGGFRQQHAGEKRAHGHGEAGGLHQERRAEHDKECGRRHYFACLGARENVEHGIEQPAPGRDQHGNGGNPDCNMLPALPGRRDGRYRREKGDDGEQRHDCEVFEQQDRHRPLADGRERVAALFENLDHDRGRGQREAHAADEGNDRRKSGEDADAGQERAADADLQRAEPEDLPPQAPEPRGLHFQADDEQEHHDAEFGDVQNVAGLDENGQAERADDHAGGEIGEDRAEPRALEQRDRDDARREQHDDLRQFARGKFKLQWRLRGSLFR